MGLQEQICLTDMMMIRVTRGDMEGFIQPFPLSTETFDLLDLRPDMMRLKLASEEGMEFIEC